MDCTTIQVFLSRVNVYIKVKYIGMVPVSFIFISVKYSEFNNLYNYVFIIHQPCNKYNVDKDKTNTLLNISWLVGFMVFKCHFQQYFSYIVVVSFIGGGNRRNRRKSPTCRKSLYHIMLYTSP
jgi:hypothetical protein